MKRVHGKKADLVPITFLLPLAALILLVRIGPAGYTLYASFFDWKLNMQDVHFIGFDNYLYMFEDPDFWEVLENTLVWTVVSTAFHISLGIVLALALNHVKSRFMAIARIVLILPYVTPGVVAGTLWRWILSGDYGYLNDILFRLGIIHDYVSWLGQPSTAMTMVIAANVWKGIPFYMVLFYARLQSIPLDFYDASRIDGANYFQTLGRITLPMMRSVIIMATILGFMWSFNFFDLIFVMTHGGPVMATETLPIYIYNKAFVFRQMSLATTVASFVLAVTVVAIAIRIMRERKEEADLM
jgi:ABC-type sugar transport system permease subunit